MEAQDKDYNVNVIRSAWHRLKKGHIKIRDLQPGKNIKGGGGGTGESKPTTSGTGTTGSH
jgi:hypothetical protein